MRTCPAIERLAQRVENASALDVSANTLGTALRRIVPPGPVEDALTGTTLGHPLHPVLVAFPIGSWSAATVLDVARADSGARRMLVGFGVLAALPTALAGAGDWLTTTGSARRIGLAHAATNSGALALETASGLARRRGSGYVAVPGGPRVSRRRHLAGRPSGLRARHWGRQHCLPAPPRGLDGRRA